MEPSRQLLCRSEKAINFSVQHDKHQMTDKMRAAIRTTAVSLPTQSKPLEPGLHFGQPQPKSSLVWILTTYQTWTSYSKQHFDKTRTYTRKINKKKPTLPSPTPSCIRGCGSSMNATLSRTSVRGHGRSRN